LPALLDVRTGEWIVGIRMPSGAVRFTHWMHGARLMVPGEAICRSYIAPADTLVEPFERPIHASNRVAALRWKLDYIADLVAVWADP
jgi:hypothetical protein